MKDLLVAAFSCFFCNILYKKTASIGEPPSSPVFIYANHNNLPLDGIIINKIMKKRTSNIIVKGLLKNPIMGTFLQLVNNIPIARPQDVAAQGEGKLIRVAERYKVHGVNCNFRSCCIGSYLVFLGQSLKIKDIISDNQLHLGQETEVQISKPISYQILNEKLDYHQVYSEIWKAHERGQYILIFPEGVSHDYMIQMPFKAGIAIMLLHYSKENKGRKMSILPIGHNYYNQHLLRSTQVAQFGQKFELADEMIELYETDRHRAIKMVLTMLEDKLRQVTTQTKQFEDLSIIITARQLYDYGCNKQLEIDGKIRENRMISRMFANFSQDDDQGFKQIVSDLSTFYHHKNKIKIKLNQSIPSSSLIQPLLLSFMSILKIILAFLLALPGLIIAAIFLPHIYSKAQKRRRVEAEMFQHKNHAYDTVAYEMFIHITISCLFLLTFSQALLTIYYLFFAQQFAFTHFAIISLAIPVLFAVYTTLFIALYDFLWEELRRVHFVYLCIFQRESLRDFMKEKEMLSEKMVCLIEKYGKKQT